MDKTKLAVEIFDEMAELYQEKFMELDLYNESLDLFCEAVERKGGEILEVACGPGNITRYLLAKRPDFRVLATDLAPNMVELARKNVPEAEVELLDCRELGQMGREFDGVMCGFVLPYLDRKGAIKLIEDAAKVLRPDGILYLSTMEDEYEKSDWRLPSSGEGKPMYIHYHESGYLLDAMKENGFELLKMSQQPYPEELGHAFQDLILVGRKA